MSLLLLDGCSRSFLEYPQNRRLAGRRQRRREARRVTGPAGRKRSTVRRRHGGPARTPVTGADPQATRPPPPPTRRRRTGSPSSTTSPSAATSAQWSARPPPLARAPPLPLARARPRREGVHRGGDGVRRARRFRIRRRFNPRDDPPTRPPGRAALQRPHRRAAPRGDVAARGCHVAPRHLARRYVARASGGRWGRTRHATGPA